jgi:hypothetical protein
MQRTPSSSSNFRRRGPRWALGGLSVALCLLGACGGAGADPQAEAAQVPAAEPPPPLESVEVAGVRLEPRSMVDGRVSLLVPEGFELLDEETLALKYPSQPRPTQVYSDASGGVNLIVKHTDEVLAAKGLDEARLFTQRMLGNMDPGLEWVSSELRTVQGREWFTLDYRSMSSGVALRNMLSATSFEGTMLMVTINLTGELEAEWAEPASAVLASVQVRSR